jgi:hypothetical protein
MIGVFVKIGILVILSLTIQSTFAIGKKLDPDGTCSGMLWQNLPGQPKNQMTLMVPEILPPGPVVASTPKAAPVNEDALTARKSLHEHWRNLIFKKYLPTALNNVYPMFAEVAEKNPAALIDFIRLCEDENYVLPQTSVDTLIEGQLVKKVNDRFIPRSGIKDLALGLTKPTQDENALVLESPSGDFTIVYASR